MPIVHAAFALAGGAAFSLRVPLPGSFAGVAYLVAVGAVLLLLRERSTAGVVVLFAALGAVLGAGAARTSAGDCRQRIPDGTAIHATGRFTTLPDSGARALLHADELRADGRTCRDVTVRVDLRTSRHEVDAPVRVEGTWLRWQDGVVVRPERAGMLRVTDVAVTEGSSVRRPVRERLQLGAQQRTRMLYGRDAPLVEALLLARTETLPRDVRQRFADSGLVHLLAISGTHVALILGVLLVAGQALRLPPRGARIGALVGVIAYVLFLGAPAPATRAALQLVLLSTGRALQRPTDARAALAVAALVLISVDPATVLDAGTQLSFAGVAGIVTFAPALERLLRRVPREAARPLAAGLAASATTLPIAALHFGTLAPIGVLAGLPGIPATGAAVPAAALPLLLSLLSEPAARFLVPGATVALHALDNIAIVAARVPGGHGFATPGDVYALLLAAGCAIAGLRVAEAWLARPAGAGARHPVSSVLLPALAAAAAAMLVLAVRPALGRSLGGRALELHVIDVGQGDAIAIRSPRGRWALVDAGPRGVRYDAGVARVLPYLQRRHADALAALVVTHPDADHIGGAAAMLRALRVHALLEPAQPGGRRMYLETLEAAHRRGTHLVAARAGTRILMDGMEMDVLHPADRVAPDAGANDYSAVILLRYGTFHALLLGDAPTAAEEWMTVRYGTGVRAQVVKIGHHGSATSTGAMLLQATRPAVALISVGRANRYGHPAPEVLARLQRAGVAVLRTDQRGSLVVRAAADGSMRVESER